MASTDPSIVLCVVQPQGFAPSYRLEKHILPRGPSSDHSRSGTLGEEFLQEGQLRICSLHSLSRWAQSLRRLPWRERPFLYFSLSHLDSALRPPQSTHKQCRSLYGVGYAEEVAMSVKTEKDS